MRDDYSTKPAFDRYAALIRSFSVGPRRPDRRPERQR
jgi:hypothetical protein